MSYENQLKFNNCFKLQIFDYPLWKKIPYMQYKKMQEKLSCYK